MVSQVINCPQEGEHRIRNAKVGSSSDPIGSIFGQRSVDGDVIGLYPIEADSSAAAGSRAVSACQQRVISTAAGSGYLTRVIGPLTHSSQSFAG